MEKAKDHLHTSNGVKFKRVDFNDSKETFLRALITGFGESGLVFTSKYEEH